MVILLQMLIKNFVTTKFCQIFKLSHPIVIGGEAETMFNQVTFIFSKENIETYYPCTWISFVKHKSEKNKKLKIVNKNYISNDPKLLFFKTTDLYTVYLFSECAEN